MVVLTYYVKTRGGAWGPFFIGMRRRRGAGSGGGAREHTDRRP